MSEPASVPARMPPLLSAQGLRKGQPVASKNDRLPERRGGKPENRRARAREKEPGRKGNRGRR